jgi:hypothetical protein
MLSVATAINERSVTNFTAAMVHRVVTLLGHFRLICSNMSKYVQIISNEVLTMEKSKSKLVCIKTRGTWRYCCSIEIFVSALIDYCSLKPTMEAESTLYVTIRVLSTYYIRGRREPAKMAKKVSNETDRSTPYTSRGTNHHL